MIQSNKNVIAFTKVALPFGWMSNMSPHPVEFGDTYRTAEALFQALRFDDDKIRQAIREQKSPMGAKLKAKSMKDKMVVEPMSVKDLSNMVYVLQLKILQHSDLKALLLDTNDAKIIEDVTNRPKSKSSTFWGAYLQNGKWIGDNNLGVLWMLVRRLSKAQKVDPKLAPWYDRKFILD